MKLLIVPDELAIRFLCLDGDVKLAQRAFAKAALASQNITWRDGS